MDENSLFFVVTAFSGFFYRVWDLSCRIMYQKGCDSLKTNNLKNISVVAMVFLISVALSSCLVLGVEGTGSSGSKDTNGVFSFYMPSGDSVSGPITPPASILIDFKYKGFIPVKKLGFSIKRNNDEKVWFSKDFTSTRHATVLFDAGNNAGKFSCVVSVTDIYGRSKNYDAPIVIDDLTPPTLSKMEFHTVEGTLIPIEKNQAFFWMELSDEESNIFDEITTGNLREKTRFFLNGFDISNKFWYNNEEMFITGAKNKLICIGNVYLENLNEGENELKMVMAQFGDDEQDFVYYSTDVTAGYPDKTPPKIVDYDFKPVEPGDDFVDFKVTESFMMYMNLRDEADKANYKPSGLKDVKWRLNNSVGATHEGTYSIDSLETANVVIPFDMRNMPNYTGDGIYNILIEVSDMKGNTTKLGPIFFELGLTQYEKLIIEHEKIYGDLLDVNYIVGEGIRFTIKTDWMLTNVQWNVIPEDTVKTADGNSLVLNPLKKGEYTVNVSALHKGINCFGSEAITVQSTPVSKDNIPPNYAFKPGDIKNPSIPSNLTVTDNLDLPNDKDQLFTFKSAIKTDPYGIKTPLNVVIIGPLENSTDYKKEFLVYTEDILSASTATELLPNEKVELSLEAVDLNGNVRPINEVFFNN